MSGGGKPGGTNWMDHDIALKKLDQEERNRQIAADDKKRAEDKQKVDFTNSVVGASDALRSRAKDSITRRGLDYSQYEGAVGRAIEDTFKRISPTDPNPGAYFTDSVFENALGKTRDDLRAGFTNSIAAKFAPGFENNYFQNNSDDALIEGVLGGQKNEAMNYITRARDRGMLDDVGFSAALGRIGEMESVGRATANKLGENVLQGNRTRLTDLAGRAKSEAGSYELGQSFNPANYDNLFSQEVNKLSGNLEGDVRGALEGQKFFELGDLIARAGQAQGSTNPQVLGADAIANRTKMREAQRGLYGTPGGTF